MNRRAIAMMFVRPSVGLSVWDGRVLHCDHTVHFSADLNLRLNANWCNAPWQQSTEDRGASIFCEQSMATCVV